MRKKIKVLTRKFFASLIIFEFLFQIFAPTLVSATSYEDANNITLGGSPSVSIEENTFNYANGSVTVKKNNVFVTTTTFSVVKDDVIRISLIPNSGYNALLHNDSNGANIDLVENVYEFTIGNATENTLVLIPEFTTASASDPVAEDLAFDFTINGESFTNVSLGDNVLVSNNFNMDALEEFYVTKITDGVTTYEYADEEYSYDLIDSQGLHIFETNFSKKSNNYVKFRSEAHVDKMKETDIVFPKTREDYFAFYITSISFIKEQYKGVEVSTNAMPDNYDFTVWNGVDLSATTLNNPGTVTAYYGENVISLNSKTSSPIKKIELVANKGVPSSALDINNTNGTITVLSNYYNQIPVKVELEDGTVGYININRIGLFIGELNKDQVTFYHGAANSEANGNLNVQTDKQRLVAVFYHDSATDYEDYDLIVNIVYKDGTTETKMATGVGDVDNLEGQIVGSDYILWSGDSIDNSLSKVSVTAVEKGAITDETTFGGATFGSGAGVVWENN